MRFRLFLAGSAILVAALVVSAARAVPRSETPASAVFSLNGENFSAPGECKAGIDALSSLFLDYDGAAYRNRTKPAERIHDRIRALLAALPPEGKCTPWVYGAEVLYSLNLFNRSANDNGESLVALALPLYDSGKFVPLTSALRKEWGGEWAKSKRVIGAYECEATTIYFDPNLPPYDLGAVIAHEIEHFMHDKFSFWDASAIAPSDVPALLLLDELLSTLHAGYLQLAFQRNMLRPSAETVAPARIGFDAGGISFKKRRGFRLGGDLDLFQKGGHLYSLWANEVRDGGVPPGQLFSDFFENVIYPDFARDFRNGGSRHWAGIFGIVERAYFDRGGPSKAEAGAVLESWHASKPELIAPTGALLKRASDETKRGDAKAWDRFWNTLDERLHETSPGCKALKTAIIDGKSAGYIGSRLGGARLGGEGDRPAGGEGDRPTVPLTPCLFPDENF